MADTASRADLLPLSYCHLDEFEEGLLPVLRHFLYSHQRPEQQGWQFAYKIAAERWGETPGLSIAHALSKVVTYTLAARRIGFDSVDPFSLEERVQITRDEASLLLMLHYMRRDDTPKAREAVADVTQCSMDPDVIRAGLSFAHRFSCGLSGAARARPQLRLIK